MSLFKRSFQKYNGINSSWVPFLDKLRTFDKPFETIDAYDFPHFILHCHMTLYIKLEDKFAVNNLDFSRYITTIFPRDLTWNKAHRNNSSYSFLDSNCLVLQGKVNTKTYNKSDDFSFPIVNSLSWQTPSYCAYTSQLVRLARMCGDV